MTFATCRSNSMQVFHRQVLRCSLVVLLLLLVQALWPLHSGAASPTPTDPASTGTLPPTAKTSSRAKSSPRKVAIPKEGNIPKATAVTDSPAPSGRTKTMLLPWNRREASTAERTVSAGNAPKTKSRSVAIPEAAEADEVRIKIPTARNREMEREVSSDREVSTRSAAKAAPKSEVATASPVPAPAAAPTPGASSSPDAAALPEVRIAVY